MKKKIFIIILLIVDLEVVFSQKPFQGSFVMSFNNSEESQDVPLLWNVEPITSGGKMALEIQDDMIKKGVSKRVLFNPVDSTWLMMIEYNDVKLGSRVHAAKMFLDTINISSLVKKNTKEKRMIEGYQCRKIIVESKNYKSEVWVTDQVKFNICKMYRLLCHCGMMSEFVRRGDWYFSKNINEMIVQVNSKNKMTGENYTMNISMIQPGKINKNFFTIDGFKISDIPEGLNCGVVSEEKVIIK